MAINYPQRYDDDFLNTIKTVIDHVNVHGKAIQDLVAEGQLTPSQYAELIKTVHNLVTKKELEELGDLSPRGVFSSASELQSKHPNGAEGVYLVESDGRWYFWDLDTWRPGGEYQTPKTTFFNSRNEVSNGDFRYGIDDWSHTDTFTTLNATGLGAKIEAIEDAVNRFGILNSFDVSANDKYYVRMEMISNKDQTASVGLGVGFATRADLGSVKSGEYSEVSGIVSFETSGSGMFFGARNASIGDIIEFNHVVVINLTRTFGAGLEPTLKHMDFLINKFHGGFIDETPKNFLTEQNIHFLTGVDDARDEAINNIKEKFDEETSLAYTLDGHLYRDENWTYDKPLHTDDEPVYSHFLNDKQGLQVSPEDRTSTRLLINEKVDIFGVGVFFKMFNDSDVEFDFNEHTILYGYFSPDNHFRVFYSISLQRFQVSYRVDGNLYQAILPQHILDQSYKKGEPIGVYFTVVPGEGLYLYLWKNGKTHIMPSFDDVPEMGNLSHISIGHRVRQFTQVDQFANGVFSNFRFDKAPRNKPDGLSYVEGVIK